MRWRHDAPSQVPDGCRPRPRVGIREANGVRPLEVASLSALLSLSTAEMRAVVDGAAEAALPEVATLLPPADGRMEVWAAGVTYRWSREAPAQNRTIGAGNACSQHSHNTRGIGDRRASARNAD